MFMIVEAESSHTLFTQFPLPLSFQGKSSVDLTFVIFICYLFVRFLFHLLIGKGNMLCLLYIFFSII